MYHDLRQCQVNFAPSLFITTMGCYINFLIKNDFHESSNFEKAKEYATKVFNQLKPEWEKMPYAEGEPFVDANEEWPDDIEIHFGEWAPWSFWMTLHDGYWDVETCINDYMINWHIDDIASEAYIVPIQCKLICKALGQPEAWICFEDRLNNSADAPSELNAWFEYAKKVGINDVTFMDFHNGRIKPGEERNDLIKYDKDEKKGWLLTGTSHPILHFKVSEFEDMEIVQKEEDNNI